MSTDDSFRNATDELRERMADLQRDIEALGQAAKTAAREKLRDVRDEATSMYGQGRERVQQFEKSIEQSIVERPATALLVAAGVGFVLGALWMRR